MSVIKLNRVKWLTKITIKWVIITIHWNENYVNVVSFSLNILITVLTFLLKVNTLWLLFGILESPASPLFTMEPLVSKMRVAWTQSLRYYSLSDNQEVINKGGEAMACRCWTRMIHLLSRTAKDFIMLLGTAGNFKLKNYSLLEFSI